MKIALFVFWIFLIAACGIEGVGQKSDLTANEVLKMMTKKYSSFESYQESGSFSQVTRSEAIDEKGLSEMLSAPNFPKEEMVTFRIYYQRPDHLYFEWNTKSSSVNRPAVIWSNGKDAFSWRESGIDGTFIWDKESSLTWAIENQTRGSAGSLQLIFDLLNGSGQTNSYAKMIGATVLREESVDGNTCFVISGIAANNPVVLWIDKETFYLRKYRTMMFTGSFHEPLSSVGEFIHQNIKAGIKIDKSIFDFQPTLKKGDMDISKQKKENLKAPFPDL